MTEFPVAPPGKLSRLLLIVVAGVLPLGIVAGALLMSPAEPPVSALVIALPLAVTFGIGLAVRRRAIALDGDRLTVKATFYTLRLPLSEIELDAARVLDLDEHRELRPWLKTNGFALPGFRAGHFRGRDRRKLFCLVTAPRVLALPLRDGRTVLLSAERPQALLETLRRVAVPQGPRAPA